MVWGEGFEGGMKEGWGRDEGGLGEGWGRVGRLGEGGDGKWGV